MWLSRSSTFQSEKKFGDEETIGRDQFEDMASEYGLTIRIVIRKPRNTDSTHGLPTYPNLTKNLIPHYPNTLWVSDITYMEIWSSEEDYVFCYLSLILDAYTEEITGWSIDETLKKESLIAALTMAFKRVEGKEVYLIHHSDRGVQDASLKYVRMLMKRGIRISMTESGYPKENPKAERINNTIKNELLKGKHFNCIEDVRAAVARAVDFYNNERPHMSIDMMTPVEAASCSGEIHKR